MTSSMKARIKLNRVWVPVSVKFGSAWFIPIPMVWTFLALNSQSLQTENSHSLRTILRC